jgi:hypothetical protein
VPTWDGDAAPARTAVLRGLEAEQARAAAGRQLDERDAEYDRGRVRKTKRRRLEATAAAARGGTQRNPFQALADRHRRAHPRHDDDDDDDKA